MGNISSPIYFMTRRPRKTEAQRRAAHTRKYGKKSSLPIRKYKNQR